MKILKFFTVLLCCITIAGCGSKVITTQVNVIPSEVSTGDEFYFLVSIRNEDDKDHELKNIRISKEFLQGVSIVSTDPQVFSESDIDDKHVYEFNKNLVAGTGYQIKFKTKSTQKGNFTGKVEVCVAPEPCSSDSINIHVK